MLWYSGRKLSALNAFYRDARLVETALQQVVEPRPAEAEPAAGTDLLAAKAEYKVAVAMTLEGEAYIHELKVLITPFLGIAHGLPYRQDARVLQGVALSQAT